MIKFIQMLFEIYRGNYGDHLVERFKDGSRRYYMTRNTSSGTHHMLLARAPKEVFPIPLYQKIHKLSSPSTNG